MVRSCRVPQQRLRLKREVVRIDGEGALLQLGG
jgi:hypothetical protein